MLPQACFQRVPFVPFQHYAKTWYWYVVSVDRVKMMAFLLGGTRLVVDYVLMAIQIKIRPVGVAAAFATT